MLKTKIGQALVEMMVGMGIAAVIMPAIVTSFFAARGGSAQEAVRMQASGRLREAREVLRIIKESSWDNVKNDGTYHLVLNGGVWSLSGGAETNLDGLFTRQIVIGPAYRTPSNQIANTNGSNTLDPSTKHVTITVSWPSPVASSVIADYYLMRLENLTYIETLLSDFSAAGTVHRSTQATNTSGGEVVLGGSGSGVGDWCNPSLVLQSLDLDGQGYTTSLSAIPGHAYATTGNNASGHTLYSIGITNPTAPTLPTASQTSIYDPTPQLKTYGLFATSNYVYATSDHSNTTVEIMTATNPPTHAGKYNASGDNGISVYVSGNVGYVTTSTNKLYAFNLTSGVSSPPTLVSANLAGTGKRVIVVGNYAYVVTSSTTKQLQIFNVQNVLTGSMPEVGSGLNVGNNQGGVDLFVGSNDNFGYLVTSYASPDFFVINLTNKNSPAVMGSYTTSNNMIPTGVTVIPQDYRAIIVGSGSDLYQVLNIATPATPTRCSPVLNFTGVTAINTISSVTESDGDAYSYILTNDASHEFQMIQGGPGGGGGGTAMVGVFDSQPFTPASSSTFNRFDANTTFPSGTYARYQVAVTNKVAGSCSGASYTFVGPNKDTTQWFTTSSTIPLGTGSGASAGYSNPGECFKYRVSLSTDNLGTTPSFNDITINYSP